MNGQSILLLPISHKIILLSLILKNRTQIHNHKSGKPSKRLQKQIRVKSSLEFLRRDLRMGIKIFLNFSSNSSLSQLKRQTKVLEPTRDILQPSREKSMQKILKLTIGKILWKSLVQLASRATNLLPTTGKCFPQSFPTKIRSAEKSYRIISSRRNPIKSNTCLHAKYSVLDVEIRH